MKLDLRVVIRGRTSSLRVQAAATQLRHGPAMRHPVAAAGLPRSRGDGAPAVRRQGDAVRIAATGEGADAAVPVPDEALAANPDDAPLMEPAVELR